ncbi:MAG: hypothetical protein C4B59_00330 [Candidatus Methanogaster sp.]|uniref:Uncharacterized protein n=1 Tax=Candidatus Methanogaster sp. TaxID=3386292 RepID=A0AC61L6N2_9EURY|nr:MAG: hypothetical protein C4B59_00330 [ANME-2 cluster archaeon]
MKCIGCNGEGDEFELTEHGLKLLIPIYYNSEKTSLAKSAEIACLAMIEFKEVLADMRVKREIEGDNIEEIDRKIKEVFGGSWSRTVIF